MNADEKWRLIHRLQRAIEAGLVPFPTCPECKQYYWIGLGEDDGPVYRCLGCNSRTTPGIDYWKHVKIALTAIGY